MPNKLTPFFANNLTQAGVKHGFFGRKGGVSAGLYDSLNCGYGSNDLMENVDENRGRVADFFELERKNLIGPYQIHSNVCIYIDKPPSQAPKADAYVTDCEGIALGILTADCGPILFYDPIKKVIGAAHAGWQGAISGIIGETINIMCDIGNSEPKNIIAAIGPCIGQASYEIGQEFLERFLNETEANQIFFTPSGKNDDKYFFDIKAYCAAKLKQSSVQNIETLPHDTRALESDFFSNRRRNSRAEPDYGRNISAIRL